jgi:hypothetical protein
MAISEVDLDLPTWGHRCGYGLANGKACRRVVADRYTFCFDHAVQAGLVAGARCSHVLAHGEQCRRPAGRTVSTCWQHPEDVAK